MPTTFDRLLGTRFGVEAVRLISEDKFGVMAAHVPPDTVGTGRALGIGFVDQAGLK